MKLPKQFSIRSLLVMTFVVAAVLPVSLPYCAAIVASSFREPSDLLVEPLTRRIAPASAQEIVLRRYGNEPPAQE